MKKFLELARVLRQLRDHHYTAIEDAEEAFDELMDFITVIEANFEDNDALEVKLENVAGLLHCTLALADVLMTRISEEQIEAIIAENSADLPNSESEVAA
jgi:hypothetical protein